MARKKRDGKKSGTEIVPAGPGILGTPAADSVIEEVFVGINEISREAGLMGAVRSGRLIVEKFFGGKFDDWRKREADDASINKLAERFKRAGQRGYSASNLSRLVAVHELNEREGVSTWKHLGLSHVRTVLSLPEADQKRLLSTAEDKKLTVIDLQKEVKKGRKTVPGAKPRGRPELPAFVKGFTQLGHAFELATSQPVGADSFKGYSAEQAAELLDKVEPQLAALQQLVNDLRAAVTAASLANAK
jgi:hypothetical protein